MTIYDFNEISKYIANKTKKETIFQTSRAKIENKDFKYIWLVGNVCCIRYKNDNSKKTIQYKTFNGVKNYIDKWLNDLELGNSTFTIYRAQGTIMVKNGYQKEAPKVKCFVELRQDYGKTEWGAQPNKEY